MEQKWFIQATLVAILALGFNATITQAQSSIHIHESHRYHLHSAYNVKS